LTFAPTNAAHSRMSVNARSHVNNYYGVLPIDLTGLKTVSLAERGGKVTQADFADP